MDPPIIGITACGLAELLDWPGGGVALPSQFVEAVRRSGAVPVMLPPGTDGVAALMERLDAIILSGGGDIDPRHYGSGPHPSVERVDAERDALEYAVLDLALKKGIPVLAICRGMQMLNVVLGGSLHQHLPDVANTIKHRATGGATVLNAVIVESGSLLAEVCGAGLIASCLHHQAVDRLGAGLVPVAHAADGIVEAVLLPGAAVLGVQWHPEVDAAVDPAHQRIFDWIAESASNRRRAP